MAALVRPAKTLPAATFPMPDWIAAAMDPNKTKGECQYTSDERKDSPFLEFLLPAAIPEAPNPMAPKTCVMSKPDVARMMIPATPTMMYIMASGFSAAQSWAYR